MPEPTISVYLTDKDLTVDLEDYIIGVVAGEMPALFEEEAIKAQAVASRSYAMSKMSNNQVTISSTINDQVFLTKEELEKKWEGNYEKYYTKISNCVNATKNKVLKREGVILKTYYFAMSNGYTEKSETVFSENIFNSVESKWDNENVNNFLVEVAFTEEELMKALNIADRGIEITNIIRNETNHVSTLLVNGIELSGINFRKKLGLRSTDFTITTKENTFIISTKGYGHGVGMSQYGANGMAKEGYDYIEILKHYYNNAEIANI